MSRLQYTPADLIKEYTALIKNNYLKLTEEDISLICRYQFILTKRRMEVGHLSTIRLKYLGSFRVFKGRVIGIKNRAKKFKETHRITQEDFERIDLICNTYLDEHTSEEMV